MNASSISCISGNCHSERNIEWAESQIKEIKELVGNFHPEPEVYDIVPYFPSRYEISVVLGIAALGTLLFSLAIHIFKL
jgi:Ni/Fe-hydrogenase subunit HybB-like protein